MRCNFHPFAARGRREKFQLVPSPPSATGTMSKLASGKTVTEAVVNRIGHLLRGERLLEFVRGDEDPHELPKNCEFVETLRMN